MRTRGVLFGLFLLTAAAAWAQESPPKQEAHSFELDGLYRQEWTTNLLDGADQRRWRLRLMPRVTLGQEHFVLGVGGDFNHSQDRNTDLARDAPPILRDNYDSRSMRLDLAYLRVKPAIWLRLEGGRFAMPVPLTEMTWDSDLRPQGGMIRFETAAGDLERIALTGLLAQGSHVFSDKSDLLLLSAEAVIKTGRDGRMGLAAALLDFTHLDKLDAWLKRQNSYSGDLAQRYRVVDASARLYSEGSYPMQLVADYCWNPRAKTLNRGLWLAAIVGSLKTTRARLEYTYASVDRDATVAAFAGDDFRWGTGFEAHRAEVGMSAGPRSSVHAIGQLQRYKDSPDPAEREHWVKRMRLELRFAF